MATPGATGNPLDPLRDGPVGPLYWVHGKERFLVDRAVSLLRERVLDPRTRDFNYDLLYGKEAGAQKILAAARTLPMMAKRRLVLVRDADGLDAKQLNELSSYAAAPSPETCLAFIADKMDTKIKFFSAFKKHGVALKLDPLAERQVPAFVRGEGAARSLRFEPGAAELIAEEVGADLGSLADAVERLELYLAGAGKKVVSVADVEATIATTRTRSVFELCDAVGEGDPARALTALGSLLSAREPALRILAMVGRTVRQLLLLRELLDQRASRSAIAERLGLPPFLIDKIEAQARRVDGTALRAMHHAIHDADRTLKSSRLDDERVMELLVLELTRIGKPGRASARGATRPR